MSRKLIFIAWLALALPSLIAAAQDASARTVQYHSQDIVPIHAKLKYTTLIEVPPTEKIMEAATGDKDFWIVDVVGNFCFVHPAKAGISSNLNLITDKGNIYSFTLQDVSGTSDTPDLKVLIVPADHSSIVAANGPPQFVPAAQLEQTRQQLSGRQIPRSADENHNLGVLRTDSGENFSHSVYPPVLPKPPAGGGMSRRATGRVRVAGRRR